MGQATVDGSVVGQMAAALVTVHEWVAMVIATAALGFAIAAFSLALIAVTH